MLLDKLLRRKVAVSEITPPDSEPPGGIIIGKTGMYKFATFRIESGEEMFIGRDAAVSHIVVDTAAEKISRKHCSIIFDGSRRQYIVCDYSSTGTFREDGGRLPSMVMTVLPRGTTIYLGDRQNSFLFA